MTITRVAQIKNELRWHACILIAIAINSLHHHQNTRPRTLTSSRHDHAEPTQVSSPFIAVTSRSCKPLTNVKIMQAISRCQIGAFRWWSHVCSKQLGARFDSAQRPNFQPAPNVREPGKERRRQACNGTLSTIHQPYIIQRYCSLNTRAARLTSVPLPILCSVMILLLHICICIYGPDLWHDRRVGPGSFMFPFRFRGPGRVVLTCIASHDWEARWLL